MKITYRDYEGKTVSQLFYPHDDNHRHTSPPQKKKKEYVNNN